MNFPEEWGHRPVEMPLVIVRGQDFLQQIEVDPSDTLPAGTEARIEVVKAGRARTLITTWHGVVSPNMIEFAVESEDVDLLPYTGINYYLYVVYPDTPDLDFCITYGSIEHL